MANAPCDEVGLRERDGFVWGYSRRGESDRGDEQGKLAGKLVLFNWVKDLEAAFEYPVMSPPARASHAKFHWGIAFTTGRKHFTDPETKLRMKYTNHGEISEFHEYHSSREEEPTEQPRALNKYGFVDHPELQMNEFAPHRLPQREGNMNGWLIKDEDEPIEHEASEKG
ncbi:hypothetical protein Tco_0250647 [Tanacetum coccineum]